MCIVHTERIECVIVNPIGNDYVEFNLLLGHDLKYSMFGVRVVTRYIDTM